MLAIIPHHQHHPVFLGLLGSLISRCRGNSGWLWIKNILPSRHKRSPAWRSRDRWWRSLALWPEQHGMTPPKSILWSKIFQNSLSASWIPLYDLAWLKLDGFRMWCCSDIQNLNGTQRKLRKYVQSVSWHQLEYIKGPLGSMLLERPQSDFTHSLSLSLTVACC